MKDLQLIKAGGQLGNGASLEIESEAQPNSTRSHGASRGQESIATILRRKVLEVDEVRAEAKDSRIKEVIEFNHRPEPETLAESEVAANVKVKIELRGAVTRIPR
jgi:hypothetical protein